MNVKSALLLMVVLLVGCRTWIPVAEQRTAGPGGDYMVELPKGWMADQTIRRVDFTTSRDGLMVQFIQVDSESHQEAFAAIGRVASDSFLPSELAELVIAELKTTAGMESFVILGNVPARIGEQDGFRLHLSFRNPKGLAYERVIYGLADQKSLYTLTYQAPSLYYFARDRETFEKVVQSFQLIR